MGFILAFIGILIITLATIGVVCLFEITIRDNRSRNNERNLRKK